MCLENSLRSLYSFVDGNPHVYCFYNINSVHFEYKIGKKQASTITLLGMSAHEDLIP